ncbi:leucine-rich repeat domain-containing protein [Psychroserpens jangbogonensis]|uniref:leucine-rich repeat domain-containing protein n=1 Tax=Psychroserpens jangbogonensis TaxID=1484460 RepID=UPI000B22B5F8|nr:leucine-rich repeat domain-containing protein [Psychroserpens jangbogonensis]
MKTHIKQTTFLLVALLVLSCFKDDNSTSKTKSSSIDIKHLTTTASVSIDTIIIFSQREILQTILDANPNSTLDWNLAMTKNLGDLTGVTTNTEGHIIELDLNKKGLSVLPVEIGQLTSLTKLSAVANSLNELPIETWNLINLRHLNLSSNQLNTIPIGIKHLINLKFLNLNYNGMAAIPQEIDLLTNLEEIGLFEE